MAQYKKIMLIMICVLQMLGGARFALAQSSQAQAQDSKFIPQCVLDAPTGNPTDEGECRSIRIYIILMFNVVNYLFGIVGALALLFYIYGGFTMILSRGNAEQTQKGIAIISAAIIGLVVVFGAYMLVRFLGTVVGLKSSYSLKG